jgi:hypothetical protein
MEQQNMKIIQFFFNKIQTYKNPKLLIQNHTHITTKFRSD